MSQKDQLSNIFDNSFSIRLLESVGNYQKDITSRKGFNAGKNNYHLLSKEEKELQTIYHFHSKLVETVKFTQYVVVFLRRFPASKYYLKNEIDPLTFIRYHTEVFLHKVHTIGEIMKLLTNYVYHVGLPEINCNWKNLVKSLGVKNESLNVIDDYYKAFKFIINSRHLNTHRGSYDDPSEDKILYDLGYFYYLDKERIDNYSDDELDSKMKRYFPKFLIDYQIKQYRKERVQQINEAQEVIYKYVPCFLETLDKPFKNTI